MQIDYTNSKHSIILQIQSTLSICLIANFKKFIKIPLLYFVNKLLATNVHTLNSKFFPSYCINKVFISIKLTYTTESKSNKFSTGLTLSSI